MFEDKFPNTLSGEYINRAIWALHNTDVIGMNYPEPTRDGKFRIVSVTVSKNSKLLMTGRYYPISEDRVIVQVKYGFNLSSPSLEPNQWGYIFSEDLKEFSLTAPTDSNSDAIKAENLIKEIISYNQQILENNLLCARILDYAKQRGIVIPIKSRQTLYNLQYRLSQRDQKLKESGYLQKYEEGSSPDFSVYNKHLIDFLNNPGIGIVISGTIAIIISVVLVAGTFAAAYALFKSLHAESKADFTYSADLTAKLVKLLPPDVYQELMKENEANQKLANKAIDQASGKTTLNTVKYLAVGFAGFYFIDKYLSTRKK
ncbi:MAG: hypothetical protein BGO29_04590 [Bacteroidales bacterium 36-12]|nr:MAG: hypothetical protein BGO29_04590 [Bacteroidales bacterium 36-12]